MLRLEEYYIIEPNIKGKSNSNVVKILFHKEKNEAVLEFSEADKANLIEKHIYSIRDIKDSHSKDKQLPCLNFITECPKNGCYIHMTGNLYNAFQLMREEKILSNSFIESIYKHHDISKAIDRSQNKNHSTSSSFFKESSPNKINDVNTTTKPQKNETYEAECKPNKAVIYGKYCNIL